MKKRIAIIALGILSLLMLGSTCEFGERRYPIYVKNNAPYSIGCYIALGGKYGTIYPNRKLPSSDKYVIKKLKEGKRFIYDLGLPLEKTYFPNHNKLLVFIFRTEILKKYDWSVIRDQYKILKRYELTLEDLKRSNWTITYTPGDEDQ